MLIENLIKNERLYRKEMGYYWGVLGSMVEESSFEVRDQAKRIIHSLMEMYPNWKVEMGRQQKLGGGHLPDLEKLTQI